MSGADDKDRDEVRTIVELVNAFHDRDVHLPTRTIFMGCEEGVDLAMSERLIKNMHVLESLTSERITIVANNQGGNPYHGMAIYDAIKQSPCKVRIIARGHVMSMGSVIFQAADERVIGPSSTQMIHYGTDYAAGHAKDVERQAAEAKRINEWMEQVYLARIREIKPNYPLSQLKKLLSFDTYLTAEQSIELGLADCIG